MKMKKSYYSLLKYNESGFVADFVYPSLLAGVEMIAD